MRLKTNKLSHKFVIGCVLLATRLPALAMTKDTEQPIYIESDMQSIDMKGKVITFIGKVTMTYGTIKINADKVLIIRPGGEKGKEIIDGEGNPSTFYQMQDNGKKMKGCALHMRYELANNLLIMTGNAYLEQLDSNITGDKIIYLVKEKKMQAYSEKGKRVTTVLISPLLQDKNKNQVLPQKSVTNSLWQD